MLASLFAASLSVLGVQALSSQCTTQVGALALLGEIGSCLQLTSALGLLQSNGSVIDPINSYLTSLCASSTPTCSNSSLTSAESTIASACASDLSGGGSEATEVQAVQSVLRSYTNFKTAACSKNSTTDQFCVVDTMQSIQNVTGQDITTSSIVDLLGGNTGAFDAAVSGGRLCTGCVAEIYQQATQANSSVANTAIGKSLISQCGASFASSPSGVVTATTSATSGAVNSSTGAARSTADVKLYPFIVTGAAFLFGGLAGTALL